MKPLKNNRPVIVGIFIFLALVILVVTVFTLGGQKKTFVKSFTINAVFNDVSGLLKGGNIWFSGVKVGTVKKISFYGNSQVLVTMSIEQDAQSQIHKDAKAKIGSDGLIGNKIIIIYGGNATTPHVEKNDYLSVEKALSTDDMLATLQANNKNLLEITNDFKSISKKIDSGKGTLGTLLNDSVIAIKLRTTVDNLQSTVANFKTASVSSKNVLFNLQDFSGKLNTQGNSIHDLVNDTVAYSSIKGTLLQLENAASAVSRFTANLETVSNRLNEKGNAVGVLLNDSAAAASLKTTLKNLESGSQKLDEDLEALQHNFLLKGFFKKKEKAKAKP
ncbi:MCE family protein [Panacibacter ginsenosidivorans]|uniref:MCE family protein n=1 Tax=Panacibacter ginsenosidivorans TaxID=1813871 RepID=A0A5B8V617_9BACT|nr:MlaD family protein [Panacibacter ginsenosidivorans]QEC66076.1 MCE family protein [Panacibacter ginsenosidivorans]